VTKKRVQNNDELDHIGFFQNYKKRRSSKKEVDDFFFNIFKEEYYNTMEEKLKKDSTDQPTDNQILEALRVSYELLKESNIGESFKEKLRYLGKN
jgi:uncharacterized FlgJ-related protein